MQHIRNQDTYIYRKWFTLLNTSCAAEAMNNNALGGSGPAYPLKYACECLRCYSA